MRYVALAAGFDGTLACDGRCDDRAIEALRALALTGRKLILVTARQLRDLLDVFPEASLFDYLVAENGGVVHRPAARESAILAQAPPEILIHELRRRGVEPLTIGSAVVTTERTHREIVADAIERLRLDLHLLQNDRALSILPSGVNKASGVRAVLEELGLSPHNLVAIGDDESDLDLFALAEHSVAVANASLQLKRVADRVTRAAHSQGFVEFAQELLGSDLADAPIRRRIVIGSRPGQPEVTLPPGECSILLSGPRATGKAALSNSLLSQFLGQHYQCCVIGAYPARRPQDLSALTMFGDAHDAPRLVEVFDALKDPNKSVLVNVAALSMQGRAAITEGLLGEFALFQEFTGRPHALFFDQAEALVTSACVESAQRLKGATRIFLTTEPARLPRELLQTINIVIALGDAISTLTCFRENDSAPVPLEHSVLETGQALVWWRGSGSSPARMQLDLRSAAPNIIPDERALGRPASTRSTEPLSS